ncbi:MAG: phosphatidate cytidylyltransferase [candidate division Zixibacteria bacterium]
MISINLTQRLIVAAIAIPIILFLIFRGGEGFLYFVLLLSGIGIIEYLRGAEIPVGSPCFFLPFLGVIVSVYLTATGQAAFGLYCLLGIFLVIGIILATGKDPIKTLHYRLTYIVWGSFYIGLLYPYIYLIRGNAAWLEPSHGRWWLFFLMGSLWVGDTAAMFFGKQFGKHQLAPAVSPNKTIEGFVGGYIGVFIVAAIFKIFWLREIEIIHFILLSVLIGTFGQLGDLVESLWKRSINIKDSSAIIPGHGGVLDRFDSLLFAAPVVYLYLKYVMNLYWL